MRVEPPSPCSVVLDHPYFGSALRLAFDRLGDLRGRTIVEVGCGTGQLAACLALRGAHVVACDLDAPSVADARRRARTHDLDSRLHIVRCDAQRMPVASAIADVVVSVSTLQYMRHDVALGEWLRVLKPGGTLLLIENLAGNPFARLFRVRRRMRAQREPELVSYVRSIQGYVTPAEVDDLRPHFAALTTCRDHVLRLVSARLKELRPGAGSVRALDAFLAAIDGVILALAPAARRWAWQVVVIATDKR